MRWTGRLAFLATVATVIATGLGFATPAHASYTERPVSVAWNPAGPVHSSVSGGSVVYVGGKLNGTGGIAAVDAATGALIWMLPANKDVRALTLSPDGSRLFAGGAFTAVNGQTSKHLAAINAADGSLVPSWKGRAAGMVRDLVVSGDTLFAGGTFTSVNGVASKGIGAVSATTGARISSFNHAVDLGVMGLALTPDALLMVGTFTQVDGHPRAQIAAIDLTVDPTVGLPSYSLTAWAPDRFCSGCDTYWDVQTDGTYAYVGASGSGGNFAAFDLVTGEQRWPYVHSDGDVQAVWLPGDGKVYLGGHFAISIYNTGSPQDSVPVTVLAAVDLATGQPDADFNPRIYKTYPGAWTLTSTPDKLWVGGDFTGEQVNGSNNKKPYLAAYPGI